MPTDTEERAFNADRAELLEEHSGQFVVYSGEDRVGVFDTYVEAASTATLLHPRPALVREVRERDPVYFVPSVIRVK